MSLKNVDAPVVALDGTEVVENGTPITLKTVTVNALMGSQEGNPTGVQKAERYALAVKVNAGGDVEFKPEDLTLLKQLVGAMYLPLVVGQFFAWADA